MDRNKYISPFSVRYASDEMQYVFSQDMKFTTFHRLWIALAKAEKALGVNISDEQIAEMEANADIIDYDAAEEYERKTRHDVMSHILAYGDHCPKAKPIIHLGATSCYVTDNTDIIIMRRAFLIIKGKLLRVMSNLREFALKYKDMPTLAYTHLQPAQLTTVGKRTTLWMYELLIDLTDLDYLLSTMSLLGSKGTTGTQASFLELFNGDSEKVKTAENMIAAEFGFTSCVPVSGQTYTRKFDSRAMNVLSGIAQSAYKFANDLRILQSFKEMEEPFEKYQVGSSAMPYKRNPMRSERICALSRYVISDSLNPAVTASTQWFERTLDDSANKRISMSEAFLAVDAILNIYINVTSGIVVYPKVIRQRIINELPFMASENIMMEAVKRGGDRQELHERIREHSIAAGRRVKEDGMPNDLIERICADPVFGITYEEILPHLVPENYTGRSAEQVVEFIEADINPILENDENKKLISNQTEIKV